MHYVILLSLAHAASATLWATYREGMDLPVRPHVLNIGDFGAIGDGKTMNTAAFRKAIATAEALAQSDPRGVELVVPIGK